MERSVIDGSGMEMYISRAICIQIVMGDADMNETVLCSRLTVTFSLQSPQLYLTPHKKSRSLLFIVTPLASVLTSVAIGLLVSFCGHSLVCLPH